MWLLEQVQNSMRSKCVLVCSIKKVCVYRERENAYVFYAKT